MSAVVAELVAVAAALVGAEEAPELDAVLERLARVAQLYYDEALRFTCDESIVYSNEGTSSQHRFRYMYSSSGGKLEEYRELIGKTATGIVERRPASDPMEGLDGILLRPYSWVFAFAPLIQAQHRYALEGEARVFGIPALRVHFAPVPPSVRGKNEWVGTAYVDRRTFQLLRVEAYHVTDQATRKLFYTTDFDVVEHGMRFPGQVRIRSAGELWVNQTYKRYRFFGVRTETEMERFVLGE
jgi:hypothetical protein